MNSSKAVFMPLILPVGCAFNLGETVGQAGKHHCRNGLPCSLAGVNTRATIHLFKKMEASSVYSVLAIFKAVPHFPRRCNPLWFTVFLFASSSEALGQDLLTSSHRSKAEFSSCFRKLGIHFRILWNGYDKSLSGLVPRMWTLQAKAIARKIKDQG